MIHFRLASNLWLTCPDLKIWAEPIILLIQEDAINKQRKTGQLNWIFENYIQKPRCKDSKQETHKKQTEFSKEREGENSYPKPMMVLKMSLNHLKENTIFLEIPWVDLYSLPWKEPNYCHFFSCLSYNFFA